MPLATSMVARQLRPIVAWGNSTGLPEVIGYSWRSDAALNYGHTRVWSASSEQTLAWLSIAQAACSGAAVS